MKRATGCLAPPLCGLALSWLAGCSGMSGLDGGSRYACHAPTGVACDSVSGVYANTVARGRRSSEPVPASPGPVATTAASAPTWTSGVSDTRSAPQPSAAAVMSDMQRIDSVHALRTPPRILRLWIRPWEDSDGDLNEETHVYVQIDSGRWRMDHVQQQIREASIPLRLPSLLGSPAGVPRNNPVRPAGADRPPLSPTAPIAPVGTRP